MDYIVTQTRVLKSEMIVFNLIWVSWGSFLTCLSVREALYDFIALYSLLSVSVSVSLACVFIPQFSPAFGGFIHPNPSGLLTRPNSLHSFHSHLDSLSFSLISFPSSFLCFLSRRPSGSTLTFPSAFYRLFSMSFLLISARANPQSWALICKLAGMLAVKSFSLSNCLSSALVLRFLSQCPRLVSVSRKHRQTLTSCCGPGLSEVLYPVLSTR